MTTTTDRPAQTDGRAAPGAEDAKAESGLDSLLAEFDGGSKPGKAQESYSTIVSSFKPVIEFARTEMERRTNEVIEKDINGAISFMQEQEELKGMPKRLIRGFLSTYAEENPKAAQAWLARGKDQPGWRAALQEARAALVEEAKGLPGNRVKTDIEAARAAISGERKSAEPAPDEEAKVRDMNNAEFMAYRGKKLAEARGRA